MKPDAPRILLVEDDATSRAFLADALAALPARVSAVDGAAAALVQVATGPAFDLWLVDAHLPDAEGVALLAALRLLAPGVPALAHTAACDGACAAALRAGGFDGVLRKPVAACALRAAVRDGLRRAGAKVAECAPHWPANTPTEAGARAAALRALFHAELPVQRAAVEQALQRGDMAQAAGVLHRLRASCGFAGAAALGAAVRALQAEPASLEALQRFRACVDAVLALAGGG